MRRAVPLVVLLLLVPAAARANAGSAIMQATIIHLVGLNFVISFVEAGMVAGRFRLRFAKVVGPAIVANFTSFFVGWVGVMVLGHYALVITPGATPLDQARNLLVAACMLSFGASVVIEWPPYVKAIGDVPHRWRAALRASLLAQTASYALVLLPAYWVFSSIGALTIERPASLSFVKPPIAWVYYIGRDDGAVWRIRTDGTRCEKVLDVHVPPGWARLAAIARDDGAKCDLGLVTTDAKTDRDQYTTLLPRFATRAGTDERGPRNTWWNFGRPADLRPETPSDERYPSFWVEFWATAGVQVRFADSRRDYYVGLDTPFVAWLCRNATVLPNPSSSTRWTT